MKNKRILELQKLVGSTEPNPETFRTTNRFLIGVEKGDCEAIEANLEENKRLVNSFSGNGNSALIIATYKNSLSLMRLLIAAGADVNLQRNDGSTALHFAALNLNSNAKEILLNSGAKNSVRNKNGQTASDFEGRNSSQALQNKDLGLNNLFEAVKDDGLNEVKKLLEPKNVHSVNKKGETLLEVALQKGNIQTAILLVDAGAKITHKVINQACENINDDLPEDVEDGKKSENTRMGFECLMTLLLMKESHQQPSGLSDELELVFEVAKEWHQPNTQENKRMRRGDSSSSSGGSDSEEDLREKIIRLRDDCLDLIEKTRSIKPCRAPIKKSAIPAKRIFEISL